MFKRVFAKDQKSGNIIKKPTGSGWNAPLGELCFILKIDGFKLDGLDCYKFVLLGSCSIIVERAVHDFVYETYEVQNLKRRKTSKTRRVNLLSKL